MGRTSLVLTVLGQDRPGLVGELSQLVAEHGGNWVESRMAHLAGQFAGILRVEIETDAAETLAESIKELTAQGLQSVVQQDQGEAMTDKSRPLVQLSLVGQDRPGIISEISQVLATHGVNVEELSTECCTAPNSGHPLFRADIQLRLPDGLQSDSLRESLEHVADDLMVEINLE